MILDEVEAAIRKYCILPTDHHYRAATAWVAATHVPEVADTATRLVITAPESACGKSRTLEVLFCLAYNPEMMVDTSKAALVATITGGDPTTIFADEADQWLPNGGPLVGIINSGHQRGKPRRVMRNGVVEKQETFAFAALAGIGKFPATIENRAVMLHIKRRGPGESVAPFRLRRDQIPLQALGARLSDEIRERLDDLKVIEPMNPLEDRPADNWHLLLAIGELFTDPGRLHHPGSWAHKLREAALALTAEAESMREASHGQKLLMALRAIFTAPNAPGRMRSEDVCAALVKRDGETFVDLTKVRLASMLEPYGVKSKPYKFGKDGTFRGYERAMFTDVWARYLLPDEEGEPVMKAV